MQHSDEMMDDFDRTYIRFLKIVAIVMLGFGIGYAWRIWQEPPALPRAERPTFVNVAEEQKFNRLLEKHGLNADVSIVYHDHLGEYFIRNNKRCKFQ